MSMTVYMLRKELGRAKKFPLVLMLEPLHACNLKCSGCGRIREYADTLGQRLSVDECLHAVTECGAPIVSICGGEPLLYPDIVELTDRILRLGKHIYLCTNGILLAEKIGDFVQLAKQNRRTKSRLYWNVHLDGTEEVHDAIVEKPGTFIQARFGITEAKNAGFYVYTNTTLYKTSPVDDLVLLAERLHLEDNESKDKHITALAVITNMVKCAKKGWIVRKLAHAHFKRIEKKLKIDGMMIAPGYGYDAVQSDTVQNDEGFFLNRTEIHELFREIRQRMSRFRMTATPVYLDFLCGQRQLPCAAWANPTRNVKGWKSPCYLITDRHYDTFEDFMQKTDWSKIGPGNDSRCQDCMMHCGYEPAAVLFGNRLRDLVRMALWQLKII
jgi:MoaA/NifB/PqqE/SkfB family radical SAM enzyme